MLETVNRYILGATVPILLIGCGLFFFLYLRGAPLLCPRAALRALGGEERGGRRESLRAVCLALAGTLGVGNLAGVAGAIALGGAGAVFWMLLSALFAMILKYAEIVLAMRHRRFDEGGMPHGSAMYYIKDGFSRRGFPRVGRWLASVFALLCLCNSLCMGNALQVSAVCRSVEGVFGIPPLWIGILFGLCVLAVVLRGSRGVLGFCTALVPLMTLFYLILALAVLILRAGEIPRACEAILSDAFSAEAMAGGVGGFFLSRGVRFGTMRGLISNEAGCGTAPTAHASAEGISPAGQGVMGMVEVLVDTVLLCTLTALVILLGLGEQGIVGESYMMVTVSAFSSVLGEGAAYFLAISTLCFGFATVLCWAHYGRECLLFLSEKGKGQSLFLLLYVLAILWGALFDSELIWQTADLAIGCMTLINLSVLLMMRREIAEETRTLRKGK